MTYDILATGSSGTAVVINGEILIVCGVPMKKLRESAYIEVDSGGDIRLLPPGAEIAERIYERHQTLTEFFVYLGVSRETAAADACKVEHDLSSETFSKIKDHVWKTMGLDGAKKAEN